MPGYGACGAMPLRAGLAEKRSLQRSGAYREAGPVLSAADRPVGRVGGALGVLSVLGALDVRRSSHNFEVESSISEVSKFQISDFQSSKLQTLKFHSLKFHSLKFQNLKCEVWSFIA